MVSGKADVSVPVELGKPELVEITPDTPTAFGVKDFYKLPGVKDIAPMRARGLFCQALSAEANAGHTTPEALALLDKAIQMIDLAEEAANLPKASQ